jgi:hypothetical protein
MCSYCVTLEKHPYHVYLFACAIMRTEALVLFGWVEVMEVLAEDDFLSADNGVIRLIIED